ncbi:RNA polymerase sigma factor [Pseudactinotalea sp. HY158]|uniref:RNA polymerase sigma factor n=1 Tax=Pseudactinotalea sp. HY158 TaxID=2654547 RepID=UPI00129CB19A|nr:hypothetical protein GCE65_01870 [Pseudactinotalea sp. HY158]
MPEYDPGGRDHEWFDVLFRAHARPVAAYFRRRVEASDIEDLTAEVFTTAWHRRADVPNGHELPWLYRTAGFLLANHRRRLRAQDS